MSAFAEVMDSLKELQEDSTLPKNLRAKLSCLMNTLNGEDENHIKANRALHELEDMTDNINIEPMARSRLYSIAGLLETTRK